MEFEQIVKRLQWLDEEHRKDKAAIGALEERLAALEGNINAVAKQIKPLDKQIANVSSVTARIDQFEAMVTKQREDFNKALDELEKKHQQRERELTQRHKKDLEPLHQAISELRESTDLTPLKRDIKARVNEEARLHQEISDIGTKIEEALRAAEEVKGTQRVLEENRRTDIKRVADVQGELTALRKRIDEARAKADLSSDALRNLDNRINELLVSESERKSAQAVFIEQQSIAQVERDRATKEWRDRYDVFKQQSAALDKQIAALEETLRAAKKAQETYNELNTRLERRINEVTEMQRLTEDRLRQEWVTFKADDQKRWTGHTLSQEELQRDLRRAMEKLEERVAVFDEPIQTMQDQLHQIADSTEKQLQELMNVAHEWLTAYERIMGHGKTKKTKKQS